MIHEIQQAEDAVETGDFNRAIEIYRELSLAKDAPDSVLSDFVSVESLAVRAHLRRKLEQDPNHIHTRVLLAARVSAPEAFDIYTSLLEDENLSMRDRCRMLLRRFDLFVSKRIIYPEAAHDFLDARRILGELDASDMLLSIFTMLARIDSPMGIPVLKDIAGELVSDYNAMKFIEQKIKELLALEALRSQA